MVKKNEVFKDSAGETGAPVSEFLKEEKSGSAGFGSEFGSSLTTGLDGGVGDEMDFGIEGGGMTLSGIPIMKLTQAMTPEVQDRDKKDIYAGIFMNDSTKTALGETVEVRVLRMWKCRAKFFPRDSGQTNVECTCPTFRDPEGDFGSQYGNCAKCPFNNFDAVDHCQQQYHIIVSLADNPTEMYRIILSKSSYKVGRKLEQGLRAIGSRYRKQPVYMFKVLVSAVEEYNKRVNAKYYVYKLDVVPPAPGEPLLPEELADEFREVFMEAAELRNNSIDYHKRMLANKAAEENPDISDSTFGDMNDTVMNALGLENADKETPAPKGEDIPF